MLAAYISSFKVEEYLASTPDRKPDLYGDYGLSRQKVLVPLTTRPPVDMTVGLREESRLRNFPLEETSGPLNIFIVSY